MNPEPKEGRATAAVKLCNELLSLLACGLLLYRMANPDGPEPLDLARDGYRRAWAWMRERTALERAAEDTLQAIRDLPETEEATSE